MKLYESHFAELRSTTRFDNGMRLNVKALYDDRLYLPNTTDYSIIKYTDRPITPNFPIEKPAPPGRYQALVTTINWEFQPGQRFIEYPNRKIPIGSKYPTFAISYSKGWDGGAGKRCQLRQMGVLGLGWDEL